MRHYHITGVFGEAENGKTTYMVKDMIKKLNEGTEYDKGYANIHIDHDKIEFVQYTDIVRLKCPTRNGQATALLGIDQIHKYLDARRSNSLLNILTSQVMIESRQHGFDTDYTTWMKSIVDRRTRPFTNLVILAQRGQNGFLYDRIDKQAGELGIVEMPWEMARAVWKRFDSTELIQDPTIPTSKKEFEALFKELKMEMLKGVPVAA